MFDYAPLATKAEELIDRFGRDIILTPKDGPSSDPSKPWEADLTGTPITVKAAVTRFSSQLIKSGVVEASDRRIVISAESLGGAQIDTEWTVTDEGRELAIIDVDQKKPGDTSIVYILQARA